MGISPRFADLDGDGAEDLVSGCYEGFPYWLPGGFEGDGLPRMLRDEAFGRMHTGRFWDPDTKQHASGANPPSGPAGRAYSALPLDWDGDGDFDLVVGNDAGGLFLRENVGTKEKFAFSRALRALEVDGEPAVVPGGYALPVAADWDGDGRLDLVSGSKDGAVWWFRNGGEGEAVVLEEPVRLVGPARTEGLGRGEHAQVEVADFDGDGDLDLLVGDAHVAVVDEKLELHGYVWFFARRPTVARPTEEQ